MLLYTEKSKYKNSEGFSKSRNKQEPRNKNIITNLDIITYDPFPSSDDNSDTDSLGTNEEQIDTTSIEWVNKLTKQIIVNGWHNSIFIGDTKMNEENMDTGLIEVNTQDSGGMTPNEEDNQKQHQIDMDTTKQTKKMK